MKPRIQHELRQLSERRLVFGGFLLSGDSGLSTTKKAASIPQGVASNPRSCLDTGNFFDPRATQGHPPSLDKSLRWPLALEQ
jgi:hypothetical protein